MGLLEGQTAIVTGAAQGIGLAIAERFVLEGSAVLLADLDGDTCKAAAAAIVERGGKAAAIKCDITQPDQVDAAIRLCVETFGPLTTMVNNAGITRDATMRKMPVEDFDAVVAVHLRGTWLGTRAAADQMRSQGTTGSVVNISSLSGKVGNIGQTNYSAAKAGIVGLSKAAAKELAHVGVRVNVIQPGLIRTPMTAAMPPEIFQKWEKDVPMGRAGEPDEIGKVAAFLASDYASYLTGITIEVAGGRHM